MPVKILFTAHATAVGGRNGHTRSSDGFVDVQLSVPKAMGGPGKPGTTTPEDLFAAGYAACFGGAVDFVATKQHLKPTDITVDAAVGFGTTDDGHFQLKADLSVRMKGVTQQQAEALVHAAHEVCPYSRATRNNIEVTLRATAV
jgi:lipoyl-dependent peroxiredoxin